MKKIMFNDRYCLTRAVLDGRKTQTRRLASPFLPDAARIGYDHFEIVEGRELHCRTKGSSFIKYNLPYKVREVVAVAQSYSDCGGLNGGVPLWEAIIEAVGADSKGWDNKMFVQAGLMPHHIRITDVRVERLQDISDEDCLKEGIRKVVNENGIYVQYYVAHEACYESPREAFAHLIDKVNGKGTWKENPYVFVYDFELVKNSMK